jgi:uncharacterized membrane protein YedE/YeeE
MSERLERESAFAPEPTHHRSLRLLVGFVVGLLFALGLAISGMTHPAKVVGFLDFFGDWDPDLSFVMGGAVVTRFALRRIVLGPMEGPLWAQKFYLPTRTTLDLSLLLGAICFGIGWGLSGFCPGPALASLVTFEPQTLLFIGAMLGGMVMHTFWVWLGASRR